MLCVFNNNFFEKKTYKFQYSCAEIRKIKKSKKPHKTRTGEESEINIAALLDC